MAKRRAYKKELESAQAEIIRLTQKLNLKNRYQEELKSIKINNLKEDTIKIKLEQEKIRNEIGENNKSKRKGIMILISQILIGVTILTFYTTYVLIPSFKIDTINNSLELAKQKRNIFDKEIELDSLEKVLVRKEKILENEKTLRKNAIDSINLLSTTKINLENKLKSINLKESPKSSNYDKKDKELIFHLSDSIKILEKKIGLIEKEIMNNNIYDRWDEEMYFNFEYSDFTIELGIDSLELNWSIITKASIDYFEIEQSTSGKSFNIIHKIDSRANPKVMAYKIYLSREILSRRNINYFRIRTLLLDGSSIFSNIRIIELPEIEGINSIKLNPIPNSIN